MHSAERAFTLPVVASLFILAVNILCPFASAVQAGQVTVAWDQNPEAEVTGYRVYYGTVSGHYAASLDAGSTTSLVISGLKEGLTYYFAAVAYDASGNESGYSNEISYAVPAASADEGGGQSGEIDRSVPGETAAGRSTCFIATAAYGSCRAPEVILLRKFRDRFLLTNAPGKRFVQFYYRVSPSMADFIGRHDALRWAARLALGPVIFIIQQGPALYYGVLALMLGMTVVLSLERRRLLREARRIGG